MLEICESGEEPSQIDFGFHFESRLLDGWKIIKFNQPWDQFLIYLLPAFPLRFNTPVFLNYIVLRTGDQIHIVPSLVSVIQSTVGFSIQD